MLELGPNGGMRIVSPLIAMVNVSGGTFTLGAPCGLDGDPPGKHEVKIAPTPPSAASFSVVRRVRRRCARDVPSSLIRIASLHRRLVPVADRASKSPPTLVVPRSPS